MKYIIVLGDGMADYPIDEIGGDTPLSYAKTPFMDAMAAFSEIGLCNTIPDGMKPGSDTANLSVMGYDPRIYYTGRSPLEALSIGVPMKTTDVAMRCNIVTLSEEEENYADKKILDHSSGEITTAEARELIKAIKEVFDIPPYTFYTGIAYRHLLIWDHGEVIEDLTPPHDVLTQTIGQYLPEDEKLREMMEKSYGILNEHPINLDRARRGLNKANSLWFWGAGTRPGLTSFKEERGLKGVMISAVDLLKGIAVGAGLDNIEVPGADGTLETNYEGKAEAAVKAVCEDGYDFAYIHVEAPDEMGHQGSLERKIKSIEYLDSRIIRNVLAGMEASGEEFKIMILPDHPTPIVKRTHTSDAVPYMIYDSRKEAACDMENTGRLLYNEKVASESGIRYESGPALMSHFLQED